MASVISASYSDATGAIGVLELQLNVMGHDTLIVHIPDENAESLIKAFEHPSFPEDVGLIIAESNAHGDAMIPEIRAAAEKAFGRIPPVIGIAPSGNRLHGERMQDEGATEALVLLLGSHDVLDLFREAVRRYVPDVPDREGQEYRLDSKTGIALVL